MTEGAERFEILIVKIELKLWDKIHAKNPTEDKKKHFIRILTIITSVKFSSSVDQIFPCRIWSNMFLLIGLFTEAEL